VLASADRTATWMGCAAELQLVVHRPISDVPENASFKRMKRAMGFEIPLLEARHTDWMYGVRGRTEVLVRPCVGGALLSARIDPSLLLGLAVLPKVQLDALLGIGARTGYAPLDTVFRIESYDVHRTAQLLKPRRLDGKDAAQQMVSFVRDDLRVSDTCVQKY